MFFRSAYFLFFFIYFRDIAGSTLRPTSSVHSPLEGADRYYSRLGDFFARFHTSHPPIVVLTKTLPMVFSFIVQEFRFLVLFWYFEWQEKYLFKNYQVEYPATWKDTSGKMEPWSRDHLYVQRGLLICLNTDWKETSLIWSYMTQSSMSQCIISFIIAPILLWFYNEILLTLNGN